MKIAVKSVMLTVLMEVLSFTSALSLASPPPVSTAWDTERFSAMASAGKLANYALIPDMVSALQEKPLPHPTVVESIAHSLALLGAREALPSLDGIIADKSTYPDVINYVKVQKARLLAEDSARGIQKGQVAAQKKVERFYKELQLSPSDINERVADYNKNATRSDAVEPTALYAMGELADMAYRERYKDYAALPGITQLNFTLSPNAALKIHLAPLSREERIHFLIETLAHHATEDDAGLTLAVEQGAAVGPAVAAKLWQMDQHREEYSHAGWDNLFRLLRSTPNQKQYRALWQHFQADPDPAVARDAQNGFPVIALLGY